MKQSGKTSRVVPLKSNRRIFLRFAAAVALILAIGFTWKTLLYESRINEITENDQQKELFLADGTLVVLNQNSKLEYPESFSGQQRVVNFQEKLILTLHTTLSNRFSSSLKNLPLKYSEPLLTFVHILQKPLRKLK
jgi:hypothetical protein